MRRSKFNGVFLVVLICAGLVLSGCAILTPKPGPAGSAESNVPQDMAVSGDGDSDEMDALDLEDPSVDEDTPSEPGDGSSMLTTRELMEEARALACTGALQYKDGDLESARANFEAALLNLQLVDLPQDMQAIQFFQPYLMEECQHISLEKAYTEIEKRTNMDPNGQLPADGAQFPEGDQVFIEMEILRLMEIFGEEPVKPEDLKVFVEEVEVFIRYYQDRRKDWFERSYYRMLKYQDTVERVFAEKRLPPELCYLAFVESGYLYRATSHAQARGIWQFIRSTGRNYGLQVGRHVDERLDPLKSTVAAREYLLDLISIFGSRSFLLAMASYNAGEGKIQRCLRQVDDPFENRSFWKIRSCLKRETRDYIPRIIAAAVICENPARFGFQLIPRDDFHSDKDLVICPNRVRLSAVASAAGTTVQVLRELNPDLPSGGYWTPSNNTHLWVPKDTGRLVLANLDKMSSPPAETDHGDYHVVRSGDNLYKIGRRYKIPYKRLATWNNIPYPYKIKPGQKIYLSPPGSSAASSSAGKVTPVSQCSDSLVYVVRKGNFLAGIGSLFGVSARNIMQTNGLTRGTIFPGQRLNICPAFPVDIIQHAVNSGETISSIAEKHGVSVDSIRFINGLHKRDVIRVGQKLLVYRKSS